LACGSKEVHPFSYPMFAQWANIEYEKKESTTLPKAQRRFTNHRITPVNKRK
jgi:hypothetical protein